MNPLSLLAAGIALASSPDAPQAAPAARVTAAQAIVRALWAEYQGLEDIVFHFDEWARAGGSAIWPSDSSRSGYLYLRLTDGAYRLRLDAVNQRGEQHLEASVIRGSRASVTRIPGKRAAFHQQPAWTWACSGYCTMFAVLLAGRMPDEYAVELVGWEKVDGVQCARVAVHHLKAGGARLLEYLRSTDPTAVAPFPALHCWVDLERGGVLLRSAFVAYRQVGLRREETVLFDTYTRQVYRFDWAPDRKPLWIPVELVTKLTEAETRAGTVRFERRLVIIPDSIRVNVGLSDEQLAVRPPPGARVSRYSEENAHLKVEPAGVVMRSLSQGSRPLLSEQELPPPLSGVVLRAPSDRQTGRAGWWFTWASLAVGVVCLVLALYLRARRA